MSAREYFMSRPQPTGDAGITRGGKIEQKGVQIFVRPANRLLINSGSDWFGYVSMGPMSEEGYRQSGYYPNAYSTKHSPGKFYVEFYIRTEKQLKVRIDQFFLTLPDGIHRRPIAYLSPQPKWSTANYALDLCKTNLKQEMSTDTPIVTHESGAICFAAIYDVDPPLPSALFRLEILGITADGEELTIPGIVFEPSKEISLHP